jgi:hypothetical protein
VSPIWWFKEHVAVAMLESVSDPAINPPAKPMSRHFRPSARAWNWLLTIGFLALGYAFYLRYLVLEQPVVSQACDGGLDTSLCAIRNIATAFFNHQVFGWIALGAAILNLIRPSLLLFAIALAGSAFGIVLHNAGLSSLAAALLITSFARPVAVAE